MIGKARRISLSLFAVVGFAALAPLPTSAVTPPASDNNQSMIHVASRCISTMKAYRQAIAFLDKRLQRSPAQVTYELSDGDSITLLNRAHSLLRLEKRVLEDGMLARERACTSALLG